jgi:hypothetical protein
MKKLVAVITLLVSMLGALPRASAVDITDIGPVTKAIATLDIHEVNKELTKLEAVSELDKRQIMQQIDKIMYSIQIQQKTKKKYLNKQTLLGCLAGSTSLFIMLQIYKLKSIGAAGIVVTAAHTAPDSIRTAVIALCDYIYTIGLLHGALGLFSLQQIYKGITTQELKSTYDKALAIKYLINQLPSLDNHTSVA